MFAKILEVIILCMATGVCASSYAWFFKKVRDQTVIDSDSRNALIFAGIGLLDIWFNLFY